MIVRALVALGAAAGVAPLVWVAWTRCSPPRIPKAALLVLVVGLPVYPALAPFTPGPLKAWKEVLVLVLLAYAFGMREQRPWPRPGFVEWAIVSFGALCVASVALSDERGAALAGLRTYLLPLAVFLSVRALPLRPGELRLLLRWSLGLSALLSLWGIAQAAILGSDFFVTSRHLARAPTSLFVSGYGFQRAAGTFAGPNEFGLYLAVTLLLALGVALRAGTAIRLWERRLLAAVMAVDFAALARTFSRSALLGLIAGFVVLLAASRPMPTGARLRWAATHVVGAVAIVAVLGAAGLVDLGAARAEFVGTLSGTESSARGHLLSWRESLRFVADHPLGVGIGRAGPRAVLHTARPITTESSYFTVAFDLGIPGLALYLLVLAGVGWAVRRTPTALAILVAIAISFLFLPTVTAIEVVAIGLLWSAALARPRGTVPAGEAIVA